MNKDILEIVLEEENLDPSELWDKRDKEQSIEL